MFFEKEISQKKRVITLALCLATGCIGLHRFYTGKKKSGFLMLVITFFIKYGILITSIWALVDFTKILLEISKKEKQLENKKFEILGDWKVCPRCKSKIKTEKNYCKWCGFTEDPYINSCVKNFKSEEDLYNEKISIEKNLPFGTINQYQYELLEKINKYSYINISDNDISDFEQIGIKELINLDFLQQYNIIDILNDKYTLKELKEIAKTYDIKSTYKTKFDLIKSLTDNQSEQIKELLKNDIENKYTYYYKVNDLIKDYFLKLRQEVYEKNKEDDLSCLQSLELNLTDDSTYQDLINLGKPKILEFMNYKDYNYVLFLYIIKSKIKTHKLLEEYINKEYPYDKYAWDVCIEIVRTYSVYKKNMESFKSAGIKKVKLMCHENCECCNNLLDKPISINSVPELPRKECEFDCRICLGACYGAILSYDD